METTLQPDLQPPGGEDVGVEGHLGGGAAGVVQHHAGDGAAVPLQEARLGDLLRASQLPLKQQPDAGRPRPTGRRVRRVSVSSSSGRG